MKHRQLNLLKPYCSGSKPGRVFGFGGFLGNLLLLLAALVAAFGFANAPVSSAKSQPRVLAGRAVQSYARVQNSLHHRRPYLPRAAVKSNKPIAKAKGRVLGTSTVAGLPQAGSLTGQITTLVSRTLQDMLAKGLLTGPAGPPGPSGLTAGFSGPNGLAQYSNGNAAAVIGGAPIVSYYPSNAANNFTGGAVLGASQLSANNFSAQTAVVQGTLNVTGAASNSNGNVVIGTTTLPSVAPSHSLMTAGNQYVGYGSNFNADGLMVIDTAKQPTKSALDIIGYSGANNRSYAMRVMNQISGQVSTYLNGNNDFVTGASILISDSCTYAVDAAYPGGDPMLPNCFQPNGVSNMLGIWSDTTAAIVARAGNIANDRLWEGLRIDGKDVNLLDGDGSFYMDIGGQDNYANLKANGAHLYNSGQSWGMSNGLAIGTAPVAANGYVLTLVGTNGTGTGMDGAYIHNSSGGTAQGMRLLTGQQYNGPTIISDAAQSLFLNPNGNQVLVGGNGIDYPSNFAIRQSGTTDPLVIEDSAGGDATHRILTVANGGAIQLGPNDTSFSRISAGVLGIGTGAAASVAGTIQAAHGKLPDLNPAADFTLTQNSVAPFTSVNSGAVANTLYLKTGNVGIGTTTPSLGPLTMASGAYVTSGGTWTNASDRNLKENFATVTPIDILQKIDQLPVTEWDYKSEGPAVKHIGPVAQDFWALFQLGNSSASISTIDPSGIALLGIQALDQKLLALQGELFDNATASGLSLLSPAVFSGDSVGQAEIAAGQSNVRVTFSRPYEYQPIVTVTPINFDGKWKLVNIDSRGFDILRTDVDLSQDVIFNWHSFASPEARLTVANGQVQPIGLVVAAPTILNPIQTPAASGIAATAGDTGAVLGAFTPPINAGFIDSASARQSAASASAVNLSIPSLPEPPLINTGTPATGTAASAGVAPLTPSNEPAALAATDTPSVASPVAPTDPSGASLPPLPDNAQTQTSAAAAVPAPVNP